jgi:hypothetical protein
MINPLLLHIMARAKMQSTTWTEVHLAAVMALALHDKHTPALLLLLLLHTGKPCSITSTQESLLPLATNGTAAILTHHI